MLRLRSEFRSPLSLTPCQCNQGLDGPVRHLLHYSHARGSRRRWTVAAALQTPTPVQQRVNPTAAVTTNLVQSPHDTVPHARRHIRHGRHERHARQFRVCVVALDLRQREGGRHITRVRLHEPSPTRSFKSKPNPRPHTPTYHTRGVSNGSLRHSLLHHNPCASNIIFISTQRVPRWDPSRARHRGVSERRSKGAERLTVGRHGNGPSEPATTRPHRHVAP